MPASSKSKKAPPKTRTPPAKTAPKAGKATPPPATPPKATTKASKPKAPSTAPPRAAPKPEKVTPPKPEPKPEKVTPPKPEPKPEKVTPPLPTTPEAAPEEVEVAPLRPAALADAAQDVGDTFEELLLERLAQEDGRGWRAGPVVSLPMDRVAAGHLGWMTTLSAPGIFTLGTIHLIVIPGDSPSAPEEIPLNDAEYDQFDSVEHSPGPPRLLLLAYARDPVKKPDVQRLAHEVFERLKAEIAPERSRRSARS